MFDLWHIFVEVYGFCSCSMSSWGYACWYKLSELVCMAFLFFVSPFPLLLFKLMVWSNFLEYQRNACWSICCNAVGFFFCFSVLLFLLVSLLVYCCLAGLLQLQSWWPLAYEICLSWLLSKDWQKGEQHMKYPMRRLIATTITATKINIKNTPWKGMLKNYAANSHKTHIQ